MNDPTPKSPQADPKPQIIGWLMAALKRCWPRPGFTPVREAPTITRKLSKVTVNRLIRAHMRQAMSYLGPKGMR